MAGTSKSPVPRPAEVAWYYLHGGEQVGPITEEELLRAARDRSIEPETLVWQQAYDRWKHASQVPMIAVTMGYPISSIRIDQVPSPRRTEPTKPASQEPAANDASEPQELTDAITDDEAADPIIDVEQAREILDRASLVAPERSIPPAHYVSIPAPDARVVSMAGSKTLRVVAGAVSLLAGMLIVIITARQPEREQTAPPAQAAQPVAPAVATGDSGQRAVAEPMPLKESTGHVDPPADLPVQQQTVVVTRGTLDVQLVLNKLKHGLPMFDDQCWDRLRSPVGPVEKHPSVRIDISVDRLGNVYELQSTDPPSGYRGVGRCIIGRMRGWKFPRAEQGSHAVITVARIRH